jgi:hypothetical protein
MRLTLDGAAGTLVIEPDMQESSALPPLAMPLERMVE